jgi:hypothetical protein
LISRALRRTISSKREQNANHHPLSPHSLINAPNKVNQYQRAYQHAYKAHTRIWRIVSRRLNIPGTWKGGRTGDGWMDERAEKEEEADEKGKERTSC